MCVPYHSPPIHDGTQPIPNALRHLNTKNPYIFGEKPEFIPDMPSSSTNPFLVHMVIQLMLEAVPDQPWCWMESTARSSAHKVSAVFWETKQSLCYLYHSSSSQTAPFATYHSTLFSMQASVLAAFTHYRLHPKQHIKLHMEDLFGVEVQQWFARLLVMLHDTPPWVEQPAPKKGWWWHFWSCTKPGPNTTSALLRCWLLEREKSNYTANYRLMGASNTSAGPCPILPVPLWCKS